MHKLFAFLSVLVLAAFAVSALFDYDRDWKNYQERFRTIELEKAREELDTVTDLAQRDKLQKRIDTIKSEVYEIEQMNLPQLGRVDRCVTCHSGIAKQGFADEDQPFRSHPGPSLTQHPYEKFGCTVCHQGQGRATTVEAAHGEIEHWEEPMLRGDLIESSCGKCHRHLPEAPLFSQGQKLFEESRCAGCHKALVSGQTAKRAWDLAGVGSKVDPNWLYRWLKNPKAYLPNTTMPNFLMSDEEAEILTAYLMSSKNELVERASDDLATEETDLDELYDIGKTRFRESRCISCHAVEEKGGTIGPELGGVATKVNKSWLLQWLRDPKSHFPETRMPRFSFPEQDIRALVEYISSEFVVTGDMEEETGAGADAVRNSSPEVAEREGRKLVKKYGCYGCHNMPGDEYKGEIGPELTFIGSKPMNKFDFGDVHGLAQCKENWIFNKLLSPRIYAQDLKMPQFDFSAQEAKALTVYLMSFREEAIPKEYLVETDDPETLYQPAGLFGDLVERYECFTCHTIRGRGGDLAPDLTIEGSRVQREWLVKYLKIPYAIRPILTERMPRLKVSDAEAEIIADYMKMVLVTDTVPRDFSFSHNPTDELVEKGRELYYEQYGCQACHMVGLSGGFIGPSLNGVGDRLMPGYIFTWLQDPHALVPDAREPALGLDEDEAEALTAYLSSLKASEQSGQ